MDEQTTPQTPEKPAKEKKGKKRTRRIILVIVLLLLLLLGGIFAYRHFVGVQPNDTVLLEENIIMCSTADGCPNSGVSTRPVPPRLTSWKTVWTTAPQKPLS